MQKRKRGRPRTTSPDLVSRTIRVDPKLWHWHKQYALDAGVSVTAVITWLMERQRSHPVGMPRR